MIRAKRVQDERGYNAFDLELRFGAKADMSYVIADPIAIMSSPGAMLPWITVVNYVEIHMDNLT
jgi:hypothetical protein